MSKLQAAISEYLIKFHFGKLSMSSSEPLSPEMIMMMMANKLKYSEHNQGDKKLSIYDA